MLAHVEIFVMYLFTRDSRHGGMSGGGSCNLVGWKSYISQVACNVGCHRLVTLMIDRTHLGPR